MDALLEGSPAAGTLPGRRRLGRVLIAGGLCAVALAVPMLVIGKAPRLNVDLGGVGDAMSEALSGGKVTRHVMIGDGVERRVTYSGDLVFNEDDTDVVSLDRKLSIMERVDDVTRRVEIVSDGRGGQVRRFWLDGESKPLDDPARVWLAGQIGLIAESAQGSEPRARRLLQRGGVEAVVADIDKAADPMTRRSRVEGLLATGPQSDATISRLIALSATMEGDFQRRGALTALVNQGRLPARQQREVLEAAGQLQGDFDRRELLVAISSQLSNDATVMGAWRQAVQGISGDFDKRTAIVALIDDHGAATPERLRAALDATQMIDGDFDRRTVLETVARQIRGDAAPYAASYVDAARKISGDFERRTALVALIDEVKVNREVVQQVLRAADGMGASFDRAELLIAVAEHLPPDAAVIAQYRQAARGLSTHDRGRVEAAIDHLTPS